MKSTFITLLFGLFIVLTNTSCSKEEEILLEQQEIVLANYQDKNPNETFWEITLNLNDVEMRGYLEYAITESDTIMIQNFCYEGRTQRFTRLFERKEVPESNDIIVSENDKVVVIDLEAYRDDNCPEGEMFTEKYIRQTIILRK